MLFARDRRGVPWRNIESAKRGKVRRQLQAVLNELNIDPFLATRDRSLIGLGLQLKTSPGQESAASAFDPNRAP